MRIHTGRRSQMCCQVRQVGVLMLRRFVGCLSPQECKQVRANEVFNFKASSAYMNQLLIQNILGCKMSIVFNNELRFVYKAKEFWK